MAEKYIYNSSFVRNRSMSIMQEEQLKLAEKIYGEGSDAFEEYKSSVLGPQAGTIAFMNANRIANVALSSNSQVLKGSSRDVGRTEKVFSNAAEKMQVYPEMLGQLADVFQKKSTDANTFMWNSVKANASFNYAFTANSRSRMSLDAVNEAFNYFNEEGRNSITLDIETFGGKNKFGMQQLDAITEYSFLQHDSNGKEIGSMKGFVGFSDEQAKELTDRFSKIKDFSKMTTLDRVTASYLAKLGTSGTTISEDTNTSGRFFISKAADPDNIKINKESIMAGINTGRDVGRKQESTKLASGMMQWEKDLSDWLIKMQNGPDSLVGHNIDRADIPWMNQFISQHASPSMRGYLGANNTSSLNIESKRILDTLAILQHGNRNENFMSTIWDDEHKGILKEGGNTPYQLEALIKRYFPDLAKTSGLQAHTAEYDVEGTYQFAKKTGVLETAITMANERANTVRGQVRGDGSQLFLAAQSLGSSMNMNNLHGFTIDEFDGQIKTMDGITIGEKGASNNEKYGEWLAKKNVTYTVEEMLELSADDKFVEAQRKINPTLAVHDLVAVKLAAVTSIDGSKLNREGYEHDTLKNSSSSYIYGTKRDMEAFFNSGMILYAETDENGKFQLTEGARPLIEKTVVQPSNGKIKTISPTDEALVRRTVQDGAITNINDSAARTIREMNYTRFNSFSKFVEEVNTQAGEGAGKEEKRQAIQKMLENSSNIAKKVAAGKKLTKEEQALEGTLQEILGWKNRKTGKMEVSSKTVDKAIATFGFFEEMSSTLKVLGSFVEKKGSNKAEKNELFRQGMDTVYHEIESVLGRSANQRVGSVRGYDAGRFEIDVTGLVNNKGGRVIPGLANPGKPDNIISINLNGGESSLAGKFIDRKEYKNASNGAEATKRLDMFVEHIQKTTGMLSNFYGTDEEGLTKEQKSAKRSKYIENTSETVFAKDIISALKRERVADPTAGFITDLTVHKVVGRTDIGYARKKGLTDNKIKESLEKRFEGYKTGTVVDLAELSRDENAFRGMVSNVVDSLLMDKVSNEQLAAFGYNKKQISHLEKTREIRRKDYNSYVEKLLRGVAQTDMGLVMDAETGTFGLSKEGRFIDLAGVPRERFSDGIFYTQVGRSKFATEMHLAVNDNGQATLGQKDISFKSGLGMALDDTGWNPEQAIRNAKKQGRDSSKLVEQWVSRVAGVMREGASVSMLDEQDMKSQFEINDKQIVDNIGKLMDGLKHEDLSNKETFIRRFSRKGFNSSNMQDTDKQLYVHNRETILRYISENVHRSEEMTELVNNMTNRAKSSKASKLSFRAVGIYDEMEIFNNASRGFDNSARYLSAREDNVLSRLGELSTEGNDLASRVGLGAHLRTQIGSSKASKVLNGTDGMSHTEFTVDRAIYSASEYQKILMEKAKEGDSQTKLLVDKLLTVGNIVEGGSIMNSRLADSLLENYDRQRISAERKLFSDHTHALNSLDEINEMGKVIPEFVIKDGQVTFEYKKGKFVNKHSALFNEEVYGGAIKPVGAKNDGALKFGFFTKSQGSLVRESEVIQNVLDSAKKSGIEIADVDTFMSLAKEKYEANFYVEKLIAEPYRKIQEDRLEKGMSTFTFMGLGDSVTKGSSGEVTGDQRIVSALDNLGLTKLKGRILNKEFFDDLGDAEKYTGSILSQMDGAVTSKESYLKALTDAGFKDDAEFRGALTTERHMASDFMYDTFKADFLSHANDEGHKNKSRPVSIAVNNMIHNEALNILSQDSSIGRVNAERLAANTISAELGEVFVKDGANGLSVQGGKIIVPEFDLSTGDHINTDALRKAYDNRMGEGSFSSMMDEGNVHRIAIAASQDTTAMTGSGVIGPNDGTEEWRIRRDMSKGFKVTDRELSMTNLSKLDQKFVDNMSSSGYLSTEEFDNVLGWAVDDVDGKKVLKDEFKGATFMGGFNDRVFHGMYAAPGEKLLAEDFSDAGHLKETAQALHNQSGGRVSVSAAETAYSIGANTMAMRFNKGTIGQEALENSKYAFVEKNFNDLSFTTGNDGKWMLEDHANSVYNKNLVINLEDDVITKDIISRSKSGLSKVAIGQIPVGLAGGEVVQQKVHKALGDIFRARNTLAMSGDQNTDFSEGYVSGLKNTIANSIDSINQLLSESVTSKTGMIKDISEVRLEKSVIGRASLMTVDEMTKAGGVGISALENAYVDGKSLLDHHKEGRLMDFKIVSREHVEAMGMFDDAYLKQVGMTAEEMEASLKSGVLATTHRNPTVYEGSIKHTTMILSDHLKGAQSVEFGAGALTAKADADGDMVKTVLAEMVGKDGKYMDSVQYKKAIAAGQEIDSKVSTDFKMANASMYYNAKERNEFFHNALQTELAEIKETKGAIVDKLINQGSFEEGKIMPGMSTLATPGDRKLYRERFDTIQNKAFELYSNKEKVSIDAARSVFYENSSVQESYLKEALNNTEDAQERDNYRQSILYNTEETKFFAGQMSSLKQSSAGEINLPLYQVRKVRSLGANSLGEKDSRLLEHVLEAAEESFLSPKHSEAKMVNNATTMEEFGRAFKSVTNNPLKGDASGTHLMEEWLQKNLPGRFKPGKVLDIEGLSKDEIAQQEQGAYKKASELMQQIFQSNENISRFNVHIAAVGQYEKGININRLEDALIVPEGSKDMLGKTMSALADSEKEAGYKMAALLENARMNLGERIDSEWTPPTSPGIKEQAQGLLGTAKDKLEKMNISGKDLAIGSLGIAGATMLLGFVGGNPAEASTTTAAAGAEQPSLYGVPSMTDNASGSIMANPNQGYIININASSPKGQSHAEEAIRSAMAQSHQSTNVNVSMNIHNNPSGITDRTIQGLFEGAMY